MTTLVQVGLEMLGDERSSTVPRPGGSRRRSGSHRARGSPLASTARPGPRTRLLTINRGARLRGRCTAILGAV